MNSPRREETLSQSRSWTISAFCLVLTVSKGPATNASVSASGSGSAYRSASASASRAGRELEGPKGNSRGVESQELARPTVRTCALLSGLSIGLSFWRREALLGQRCRINRRLAQVRFVPGHCALVRPCALSCFYQHCQHASVSLALSSPTTLASHRFASHRISSHHTTALLCSASQHRIASRKVESSRHRQPRYRIHTVPQLRNRAVIFYRSIASIASSRDFPSTPSSIHPSIPPSIHQSRLTHSNRVTASSTKSTISQLPQSRLLHPVPPCNLHLP